MADHRLEDVTLEFLDAEVSRDVRASLEAGLTAGAVFEHRGGADQLFRAAVWQAIKAIESKDKDDLLPRFLSVGPYFDKGPIPREIAGRYMPDPEVAAAIRLIFHSAINSFQGQLAELLAVRPAVRLAQEIGGPTGLAGAPQIFVGDAARAHPLRGNAWLKAADLHLLDLGVAADGAQSVTVRGLVEVKSYSVSAERLRPQVEKHLRRARRGLEVQGEEIPAKRVGMGGAPDGPARILVVADTWKLPRRFRFDSKGGRTRLIVDPPAPPVAEDRVEKLAANLWKVTLRWSQEALAGEAYAMTFWYMGELGRLLYEGHGLPREWSEMTPEQAGRNAVTRMLYYAILRARSRHEASRATALYNSYGFGYALGSNFVDRRGRRQVLFVDDLREILKHGRSRRTPIDDKHPAQLCRIRGFEPDLARTDGLSKTRRRASAIKRSK
jgi:hypothetical protein